ncbi:hypothetical protein TREMEDRAFT_59855 [Tremella mesenterica DSM 1558]|uniref:uncharacterized protein n=1 Tax=Tremella mesenterica (strain ATCC 24925 / CBS 8224 / DSM 1558 / NBRC 9311 / NRRL Y-6157 / RJB 2259-6 / UBC 559-6) TaxID=578456 RepID=UPI0003F49CEA|nr:uncharacterized protein TREMEDRAFT_59855 [Tremella mesenterica DSM 1558]EIW73682.1 hypothetical protein TREMEDRAFT_59855 [Tremella mesenterica DSM 1558]
MFSIKKKLGALIPNESTRDALQNVLTVEWSGHKTVLVQVPGPGDSRGGEMEMSGMGRDRDKSDREVGRGKEGYGKLDNWYDDQEERSHLTSHHQPQSRPPAQRKGSNKKLPSLPHPPHGENPFENDEFELDMEYNDLGPVISNRHSDYDPLDFSSSPLPPTPQFPHKDIPRLGANGMATNRRDETPGEEIGRRKKENPWKVDDRDKKERNQVIWGTASVTSPTTSNGTRSSTIGSEEDPFR